MKYTLVLGLLLLTSCWHSSERHLNTPMTAYHGISLGINPDSAKHLLRQAQIAFREKEGNAVKYFLDVALDSFMGFRLSDQTLQFRNDSLFRIYVRGKQASYVAAIATAHRLRDTLSHLYGEPSEQSETIYYRDSLLFGTEAFYLHRKTQILDRWSFQLPSMIPLTVESGLNLLGQPYVIWEINRNIEEQDFRDKSKRKQRKSR